MKKRFFIKNALLFVIPLFIPVAILGALSIFISQQYEKSEIHKNNLLLFNQLDRSLEQLYAEMDSLFVSLGNSDALYRLEETLQSKSVALDDLRTMKMIQNHLNTPATVKPYINSVYVYVENPAQQFLVDGQGLVRLAGFHDTAWHDSYLANKSMRGVWSESRQLQHYDFTAPFAVTTLYKNLISTIQDRPIGVIVMNIDTIYMERLFDQMTLYPNQRILIVDDRQQIVFQNETSQEERWTTLQEVQHRLSLPLAQFAAGGNEEFAVALADASAVRGWSYVLITPQQAFGELPFKLRSLTSSLILLSLVLSLALSYLLSRRSTRQIRSIVSLLHHAEQGKPLPATYASRGSDIYGFITEKIIKNFIEQHYLNIQLSEKKYRLQAAQLLALQAQIHPHFLHNTLQTIYWKVIALTGTPNEASQMMENLSGLLKYALEKPQDTVPIEREISTARHYLDLQKVRYRDRISVSWQYDPEEIAECATLKLLMQPLLENSIHHGLRSDAVLTIKIKLRRSADALRITIVDNGAGLSRSRLADIRQQIRDQEASYSHIGLVNTAKRLQLRYGEDKERLIVHSKAGLGTSVTMCIPQHALPDESL